MVFAFLPNSSYFFDFQSVDRFLHLDWQGKIGKLYIWWTMPAKVEILHHVKQRQRMNNWFKETCSSEKDCVQILILARWDGQVRCPACKGNRITNIGKGTRERFKCSICRLNFSATSGSIFDSTKVDLKAWFYFIYFYDEFFKSKTWKFNVTALSRELGITRRTLYSITNKIEAFWKDPLTTQFLKILTECIADFSKMKR